MWANTNTYNILYKYVANTTYYYINVINTQCGLPPSALPGCKINKQGRRWKEDKGYNTKILSFKYSPILWWNFK